VAIIHPAELRPSKLEVLGAFLPTTHWYDGPRDPQPVAIGAYRFDDPAGQVGVETHLLRVGEGPILQVPLTYRGTPLPGADDWLVTTMEHSVLGRRWVYDACHDPVYASALAAVILGRALQAEELVEVDGRRQSRQPSVWVSASGVPEEAPPPLGELSVAVLDSNTVIDAVNIRLRVHHVLDLSAPVPDGPVLTGVWRSRPHPVLLASAQRA
jgi:hypothetical protein